MISVKDNRRAGQGSSPCQTRPGSLRAAFTLVELMATLAIIGMLFGACMSIIASLRRAHGGQQERFAARISSRAGMEFIRDDLAHAGRYRVTDGSIILECARSLDESTMEQRHLPAVVRYAVVDAAGRTLLVRTQTPMTKGKAVREIICAGPSAISLECPDGEPSEGGWSALKGLATLTLTFADDDRNDPETAADQAVSVYCK